MKDAILALDQGTTSSRAIVYDLLGRQIAVAQQEFSQIYPHPGWVEHDPEEIWFSTRECMVEAVKVATAKGYNPIACGITNQRETTILWDRKTGNPVHNAIVWQDRRTADVCAKLRKQDMEGQVQKITGLLLDPYFSATKIAWILDHVTGARDKAKVGELAFGTVDSWLLWQLTEGKVHATDATNAARTALYDIGRGEWSREMLDLFNVPAEILPDVRDCAGMFGKIAPHFTGRSIPVTGMAGDQQSAAMGQACFAHGDVKSTYGTGSFLLLNTGEEMVLSQNRLLTTIAYRMDGKTTYAMEGSILSAGATIQWVRDGLGLIRHASDSEVLAQSIESTGGVYLVPAFAGLGAPNWDADARGAILGLTRGAGKAEIVRAALESVAYQTHDLMQALAGDGVKPKQVRVDGGMVRNNWLLQFLADVLVCPVERPVNVESTAIGAAGLAALGAGVFSNLNEISSLREIDHSFSPHMQPDKRQTLLDGWNRALHRVLC